MNEYLHASLIHLMEKRMAAKKAAAKKATKKPVRNTRAPSVSGGIPEGFTMPASANTPFHDFSSIPVLQGTRIAVRTVNRKKPKKGESKTMEIMTIREKKTGALVAVSMSYALQALFAESKNGGEVFIRKDGQKKIDGGRKVNEFTCAFDNTTAAKQAKKR